MLPLIVILFLVALISLGAYVVVKKPRRTRAASVPNSASSLAKPGGTLPASPEAAWLYVEELGCRLSPDGVGLWKRLVTMKLGDRVRAKNLVLLERKYQPDASMEV